MRILQDKEESEARNWLLRAAEVAAKKATCLKAKSGAIIVRDDLFILGTGWNSPPGDLESQRRCLADKSELHEKVTDPTCCVHAEDRAINEALGRFGRYSSTFEGARMYYIRLDLQDNIIQAGQPYCTSCSKRALDVGIKEWVLWHPEGICVYDSEEYNKLSFEYKEGKA